ncbi:RNA polymerase subunit sigma-28 [Paraburkholderia sp. LEh10]|uniref:RNA polymerase subunit sigma-28 n=1 Tax=Paraburkholderia sp. LEh10 TaxID=2821353 RepID=UPI001AE10C03|nr:RNA polymerase subunit sigma-28 [Paraburkholderia sp. LEh10]MBP0593576.1 RNA polymerase subunit sigma-28 [Paraburkholderia sp. LEh10]
MKTAISYRNVPKLSRPGMEELLGRLAERRLQPHLSHFPAELVRLHATLERSRHRSLHGNRYRVGLQLALPGATLACGDESSGLEQAIDHALMELARQVERHIAHLRNTDAWRRKERRTGLRQLKTTLTEQGDAGMASFGELVRPLLPSLQRFVQRELSHLQARGDLAPGDPSVDEIVDETLARACEQMVTRTHRLEPLQWLYQIALSLLAEEVDRRQSEEGRCISLEGRLPVHLCERQDDDGESRLEYWQPDEVLRVEDVMPATDGTPEEVVSEREVRELLATLLTELPAPWREAVVLCRLEGLEAGAAAQVLGVTQEELQQRLAHADAFLRARLGDLRLTPSTSDGPASYIEPGVLPQASRFSDEFDEATLRRPAAEHPNPEPS